jgi:hypothetical protein
MKPFNLNCAPFPSQVTPVTVLNPKVHQAHRRMSTETQVHDPFVRFGFHHPSPIPITAMQNGHSPTLSLSLSLSV